MRLLASEAEHRGVLEQQLEQQLEWSAEHLEYLSTMFVPSKGGKFELRLLFMEYYI